MFEFRVQQGEGQFYPVYRRSGMQQWRYVQVDGQIVSFDKQAQARRYVEAVRAEMMGQGHICRVLVGQV